jgi:hypothetical protein
MGRLNDSYFIYGFLIIIFLATNITISFQVSKSYDLKCTFIAFLLTKLPRRVL